MTDNTQLNIGAGGDVIRTIDRSVDGTPIPAKTQVVALDVGGEANESLVASGNPIPAAIQGVNGDDLNDINIFETLIRGDLALNVNVNNQPASDVNGNPIASDCPALQRLVATSTSQVFIIDTKGYQSVAIHTGTMAASLTGANDLSGIFNIIYAVNPNNVGTTPNLSTNAIYLIPASCRYIKLTITTVGWATYYLRNVPANLSNLSMMPVNLIDVGGTAVTAPVGVPVNIASIGGTASAANGGYIALAAVSSNNFQSLLGVVTTSTPSATSIKSNSGRIMNLVVGNPNSTPVYLKLFQASAPLLGTTAATLSYFVPANSSVALDINDTGLFFNGGLSLAVTGGSSLTDTTSITTGASVNLSYI